MLRLNQGNLYILPEGGIAGGYFGNLTYHNSCLSSKCINRILMEGHPHNAYNEYKNDPTFNEPLYLNQYNKLEMHNT
jgi:hypothetical protein